MNREEYTTKRQHPHEICRTYCRCRTVRFTAKPSEGLIWEKAKTRIRMVGRRLGIHCRHCCFGWFHQQPPTSGGDKAYDDDTDCLLCADNMIEKPKQCRGCEIDNRIDDCWHAFG